MKTKTMIAAVAMLLAAGAAQAQTGPRGARGDANGDGRVSRAEFVDGRVQRLTAADSDRNGQVSVEERRAAMQARRTEGAERAFQRLDADRSGQVSRAEFDAARAERGEHRAERGPRHGRRHGPGHGGMGHGGMGHGAGQPVVIADVQARLGQRFDQLDANRDGFLTEDERRAQRGAPRAPAAR